MRNLHLILLQEYRIEAWCLFRNWERLRLRASDYKNHRIFTLRCLHKDLVPVSIKLKSTLTTSKARQIIRKAEKDLLQVRVKAINNILDQVAQQTEHCRTQLASIISAERLSECQDFNNKVSEVRFNKVKQRQLNKFNILINKKQGNITRANATTCSNNLVFQSLRQASASGIPPNSPPVIAHLPPGEGSNSLPAAAHLPLGEGNSSFQVTALLPSEEGSNSSQATALIPTSKGSSNPQVTNSSQTGQSNNSTRSVRQGHRQSPWHRATQSSQENSTISQEDNSTATPQ